MELFSILLVIEIMTHFRISGVPVVDNNKLIGILTNRDIRFETNLDLKVSERMTGKNLVTVKKIKNSFKFENLTLAPIDKSLIKKELLNKNEIKWLNNYHLKVFYNLKKYMNKTELIELKNFCSNI